MNELIAKAAVADILFENAVLKAQIKQLQAALSQAPKAAPDADPVAHQSDLHVADTLG